MHDLATGTTTLVSVQPDGKFDQYANGPVISANGQSVAFSSSGDMTGDGAGGGMFVRDLTAGTTTRASVSESGEPVTRASSASLSADGTKVAFQTSAPMVAADTNALTDVYVRDLTAGTTTLVSANQTGAAGDRNSSGGVISGDGNNVVFYADSTDLVGADTNERSDVFIRDLVAGSTSLISATPSGASANGDSTGGVPSADGSQVAFLSDATDLGPTTLGYRNVFFRCLRNC